MDRLKPGGIAQLAEHELCKLGVTGSSPVASTSLRNERRLPRRSRAELHAEAGILMGALVGYALASHDAEQGRVAQLVRARP